MIKCKRVLFFYFFIFCSNVQRKFHGAEAPSLPYQRTRQQQFPRGVRGDSRLQEIPERAQISGGDLGNFELWTPGIQSGAIQPVSDGDTRHTDTWGLGVTFHKNRKDAYCCCTRTFFFFPPNANFSPALTTQRTVCAPGLQQIS